MKSIHFIINPIAGKGNNCISENLLRAYFPMDMYDIKIKYTSFKKEAIELTKASVEERATIIVACGGDGTVNEVASILVNTDVILGIIPIGSGNGLASNIKIPRDIEKALTVIKNQITTKIDVGCCNGMYFFSNTGFGFDAKVVRSYEESKKRNLKSYLKACFRTFIKCNNNNEASMEVIIDDIKYYKEPLLIFISNSNELGYNFSLTPKACLQDGLLDVLIVPKMHKVKLLLFGVLMLFKKHIYLKDVMHYQTKKLDLISVKGNFFDSQIDGEYKPLLESSVSIKLLQNSLTIII
ncbi:diacylglycerol kinase family lipid kinase [Joostella atrarenae]|uniref:Diacylglycerol kinase family lipid kinase n=1 Tax=Joostella atrarenae TaxID=679257 RepID=A0ABS9J5J5_9FLAO|nr:diacylglycerol kinase family protein [Joostella atrarenae]MCF8715701.1 diacylglycerol kinase family lipid kinase [Joostella atrarenae]